MRAPPAKQRTGARSRSRFGGWRLSLVLICLLGSFAIANVSADSSDDRRMRAGARLLRSLLSAEVGIERKAGLDGALQVLVIGNNETQVAEVRRLLVPTEPEAAKVRGLPLRVQVSPRPTEDTEGLVAVFISDAPGSKELEEILRFAKAQQILVFSPFEGHVERGVHAGLSVEAKVQPYLNERALRESGIELKPFFLRVAKVYR